MLMVLPALAMHLEFGVIVAECKCDGNKLVLVVTGAFVARHNDACITNFDLSPCILGNGVDAEHTATLIRGKDRDELCQEGGRRTWHSSYSRDGGILHREHSVTRGHPRCCNYLVPEGNDTIHSLLSYQVRGAFHFDDSFVLTDTVVAVLKVETEEPMSPMSEEDISDRAVDDGVDLWSLARDVRLRK